ncbi:hypothetical protein GKZ90_0021940 [Flavobacterium sp. MC2016-06]|uniref:hypothetical protein n=1 Tax=Flavobacterium sp. MC2016-06 TaxID=2676308 RepID=UPI0012BA97A3|nr:hypothetical protein [Flavobacterium sp. MC2016-06]MBU3861132.1 hypothetical protein [Flavobacterium sp. MC2016-06]
MSFKEISMSIEMNSFIEFYNEDDDDIFENHDFNELRAALDIDFDICKEHKAYYSNGTVGYCGNVKVFFSNQRMDTFILLDLSSEPDGFDQITMIIRYNEETKNLIKPLSRKFYDRTENDSFYLEGNTLERNSRKSTDLTQYPKLIKFSNVEYLQDIEFYQNGIKLPTKINLNEIYSWPFTKEM